LYLTPHGDDMNYLRELRLTAPDTVDSAEFRRRLHEVAEEMNTPKLKRAAERLERIEL
jgi:hypothetical protein